MNAIFLANPIVVCPVSPTTAETEYYDIESQQIMPKVCMKSSVNEENGIIKTALANIGKYFIMSNLTAIIGKTIHPQKHIIQVKDAHGQITEVPFSKLYEYMRKFSGIVEMENIAFGAIKHRHEPEYENEQLRMIHEFSTIVVSFIEGLYELTEYEIRDREIFRLINELVRFYGYDKPKNPPKTYYTIMMMRTKHLLFVVNV